MEPTRERAIGVKRLGVALALVLYCASFFLPASLAGKPGDTGLMQGVSYGIDLFIVGLLYLPFGPPAWLGNAAFWIGLILLQRGLYKPAWVIALVGLFFAAGCSLSAFQLERLSPLIGFYVWLGSLAMLGFMSLLSDWMARPK